MNHEVCPFDVAAAGAAGRADEGEELARSGGTSTVNAPTRLTMPYPYSSSLPGGPLSMAVAVNRWVTSVADMLGNFARTNAAAPATIAVAPLVPVSFPYPCRSHADSTSTAGADNIRSRPVPDTSAWLPLRSTPPTATTPGYAAGYQTWSVSGTFPAAATTTMSEAMAFLIASC